MSNQQMKGHDTDNGNQMNEISYELNLFIEDSLKLSTSCKWEMAKLSKDEISTLYRIQGFCSMISQTAITLASSDALWEGEILMRTISEGTMKLLYICCDLTTVSKKLIEYREELPTYSISKDSSRADYINSVDGLDEVSKNIYTSLNDFVTPFEKSKKERNEVERKWSYLEMLNQIEKTGNPGFCKISALAYKYGLSSHLVHADYDAIGIVWGREFYKQPERDFLNRAHICALLSDILSMTFLRAKTIFEIGEGCAKDYATLQLAFERIMRKLDEQSLPWKEYLGNNCSERGF
jgi:hypothetical protein